jgi:signal transduction histidine kinase
MLGGTVRVVSLKGKGTRIEIEIPADEFETKQELAKVIHTAS